MSGWGGLGVTIAEVSERLSEQRRPPGGGAPYTLSGVLNLVAYAPDHEELERMQEVIEGLADHQASRTILIAEAGEGSGMDASVSTSYRLADDSTTMALELVVLTIHGETRAGMASACMPLLRSELPTVLWWPAPPGARAGVLGALLDIADRVVTEAGRAPAAAAALRALSEWIPGDRGPAVTDLAWAAITPWRQLIVQLLDSASLEGLRRRADVAILHAGPAPDAGALLLAGWLSDFLGADEGVELRSGEGPGPGVLAVEIGGPTGRHLAVERLPGREAAAVAVTEPDGSRHARTLPLPDPDRAGLLAGELEIQRRDRAFERALARAPV